MKWKQLLLVIGVSALSAVSSVWIYGKVISNRQGAGFYQSADGKAPVNYAGFFNAAPGNEAVDFTKAANAAVPAVVHIKTKTPAKRITNQLPRNNGGMFDDFFDQFFSMPRMQQIQPEQRASGSGVLMITRAFLLTEKRQTPKQNATPPTAMLTVPETPINQSRHPKALTRQKGQQSTARGRE